MTGRMKLVAEEHHSPDKDRYIVHAVHPGLADQKHGSSSWNFPAQPSDQFLILCAYSTTDTKGTGNVAIHYQDMLHLGCLQ